jgi:hypothetical protein
MIKFLKIIFTWWNSQTIGTFLITLFFGKIVGIDDDFVEVVSCVKLENFTYNIGF